MRTIDLPSWADFSGAIKDLRGQFGTRIAVLPDQKPPTEKNTILFRGQANGDWNLQTTLERITKKLYTVHWYLGQADRCLNEIESVTGRKWELVPYPEAVKEIESVQDFMRVHIPMPHYEYIVYLRHHGFPSPLLDWTTSPYIAAYFAFEQNNDAERCSIFAFIETPQGVKGNSGGDALIRTWGPYVSTHVRHFAQKAWYTTATKWDDETRRHTFCSHHEKTIDDKVTQQDVLIKFTLPRRDQVIALKQLDADYNINAFTLFQSEDALAHTMGLRTFDLK